jgi:hypothetical protein
MSGANRFGRDGVLDQGGQSFGHLDLAGAAGVRVVEQVAEAGIEFEGAGADFDGALVEPALVEGGG